MGGVQTIVWGSVLGVLGALPSALLLERTLGQDQPVSVMAGIASTMVSFVVLSCAIFAVWLVSRDDVLVFGVAEASSFLFVWAVEAVRAWRDAQRGAGAGERK